MTPTTHHDRVISNHFHLLNSEPLLPVLAIDNPVFQRGWFLMLPIDPPNQHASLQTQSSHLDIDKF